MPISFENNNDAMFYSKTALLSYFDRMLDLSEMYVYKDVIQRKSILKALDLLGIPYDPMNFRSENDIDNFINSYSNQEELGTMIDLYSSNIRSCISSYSKINRVELFDKTVYSLTLFDEDIDEELPDIYVFDNDDFLDYLENIFKEDNDSKVLSFLSDIPTGEYIKLCDCSDVLYHDFQMSIDQKTIKTKHGLRGSIAELSIGFRSVMENLFFNATYYFHPSLSVCDTLDNILRTSYKYNHSDLDRFEAAAFSLDGETHYFFPVLKE